MSTPKALPDLPAILPSGELDCPEDPSEQIFSELAEFSTGLPEVLAKRRRKAAAQREAEDSAAAVARAAERARLEVSKKRKRTVATPERLEEFGELIRKAAVDSGTGRGSVAQFCALLDLDDVPTPWPERLWRDAYKNRQRRSAIRGVKRRSLT